jgi:hypothetical protein
MRKVKSNKGETILQREKERKNIGNHKRDVRTTEKHRETEATEKSNKHLQAPFLAPKRERGSQRCKNKVKQPSLMTHWQF